MMHDSKDMMKFLAVKIIFGLTHVCNYLTIGV